MRRLWRWLRRPRAFVPTPDAECPVCVVGAPVVVERDRVRTGSGNVLFAPRTRQELVAACAEHGRSPFNDRTKAFLANRD